MVITEFIFIAYTGIFRIVMGLIDLKENKNGTKKF